MIEIKNLTKIFPNKNVFFGCNFLFPDHGIFLITGENGSGKSTLFSLLSGFDQDYQGEILIDGKNVGSMNQKELVSLRKDKISLIVQHHSLIDFLKGETNKEIYPILRGERKRSKGKPLRKYSTGGKSDLAIQREKKSLKRIYLFDEVTNALDDKNFFLFKQWMEDKSKDTLILIATHDERLTNLKVNRLRIENGKLIYQNEEETTNLNYSKINKEPISSKPFKLPLCFYHAFVHKHVFLYSLYSGILAFLYILIVFPLFMATADFGQVFVSRVPDNALVNTVGNAQGLQEATNRYYRRKASVLLSSSLPDDKQIHIPKSRENDIEANYPSSLGSDSKYVTNLLGYKLSLSFSFDEDSSLPEMAYCTNPDTIQKITSEDLCESIYSPFNLIGEYDNELTFSSFSLPRMSLDPSLFPTELEDDTFYCSENAISGFQTREEHEVFAIADKEEISPLFPTGVKLQTIEDKIKVLPLGTCYVSENTMTKILQMKLALQPDAGIVYYPKGNKRIAQEIIRSPKFYFYNYDDVEYKRDADDTEVGRSIASVASWMFLSRDFQVFSSIIYPISFLLLGLFKTLMLSFLIYYDEANRKLWYSFGIASHRISLFYFLPLMLCESVSLIIAYCFSQLSWTVSFFPLNEMLLPNAVNVSVLLALEIFSTVLAYLFLYQRKAKKVSVTEKKTIRKRKDSFFSFFNRKNYRDNSLHYLAFSLLALSQYLLLFFGDYNRVLFPNAKGLDSLLYSVLLVTPLLILSICFSMRLSYERNVSSLVLLKIRGCSFKKIRCYFYSLLFLCSVSLLSGHLLGIGIGEFVSLLLIHRGLSPMTRQSILGHFLLFPYLTVVFVVFYYRFKVTSRKELHRQYKGNEDD